MAIVKKREVEIMAELTNEELVETYEEIARHKRAI